MVPHVRPLSHSLSMTSNETPADRYRRKLAHGRAPEDNLRRFQTLQRKAFELLQSNPQALAAFHQRNRRKRRASEVAKLFAMLRPRRSDDR